MPIFWWALFINAGVFVNLVGRPVSGGSNVTYLGLGYTALLLIDSLLSDELARLRRRFTSYFTQYRLGTIPMAVIARMTRSSMLGSAKRRLHSNGFVRKAFCPLGESSCSCAAQRLDSCLT